jgi:L-aminopeptidase/D-esterase-like protein
MGGQVAPTAAPAADDMAAHRGFPGGHTTIGVVATNVALDKGGARRVAIMAHDGYARAIRPVHTPFDGDTVFCLASATDARAVKPDGLSRIGALAADCMARAIGRAIWEARSLGDMVAYRDWIAAR